MDHRFNLYISKPNLTRNPPPNASTGAPTVSATDPLEPSRPHAQPHCVLSKSSITDVTLRTKLSLARMSMTGTTDPHTLCFHVYRIGAIWGDDRIVRADDRKTPRYFLKGTRLAASWQFALHAGGPNGVVVCHIKSGYLGPPLLETSPGPINISIGSEGHTVQVHHGNKPTDATYAFKGLDDQQYRWKPISRLWGNTIECLNSQDQVVATYRITLFAMSKDGELRIHQPVQSMTDLIVATCLAMRTPDH